MFIILKMYHITHTHMVIMIRKFHIFLYWLTLWPMDYWECSMLRRPTLDSYHQHDFSRLSSEKLIFWAIQPIIVEAVYITKTQENFTLQQFQLYLLCYIPILYRLLS